MQGNGHYTTASNWVNHGTFNAGTSTVTLNGVSFSIIDGTGSTSFYNLEINKTDWATVGTNFTVENELKMTSGNLNLSGYTLTLNGDIINESAASYIYGDGTDRQNGCLECSLFSQYPGNLGVTITSSANLGTTTIQRGHDLSGCQWGNGECFATMIFHLPTIPDWMLRFRFHYLDHELNGIAENDLTPFRFENPDWTHFPINNNDPAENWVETLNVDAFSLWTLAPSAATCPAGDRTWTGIVSTDWDEPGNWNPICVPTADDDVIIPDVTNDPVISSTSTAVAKSVKVNTGAKLTINSSGSLTIDGPATAALLLQGSLDNSGILNIANTEYGIFSTGHFENLATAVLNIGQNWDGNTSQSIGLYLVVSGNTFSNAGEINIDNYLADAIQNIGTFNNNATINVGQNTVGGNSGRITNGSDFDNNAGGIINIDNVSIDGIGNTGQFNNAGAINIGQNGAAQNIGDEGIFNNGSFNNFNTGIIQIDNTVSHGMQNRGTISNSGGSSYR